MTAPEFHVPDRNKYKYGSDWEADFKEEIERALAVTALGKLRNHFQTPLETIKEMYQAATEAAGYFEASFPAGRRPGWRIMRRYLGGAVLGQAILIGLVTFSFSEYLFDLWLGLAIFILIALFCSAALYVVLVAYGLPRLAEKGKEIWQQLIGLKEYMKVAEKARLEFHFDPAKNADLYEKLLPFAIAMGVEERWTKSFKDLVYKPDWYKSSNGQAFSTASLHSLVSGLSATAGGSSSGGHGAGGGRGGGGGGSR